MRRLCAAEWFLSHPASEVITLSTLSTGGGAFFFFGENFSSSAQRRRCSRSLLLAVRSSCTDRSTSELKSPPSLPPSLHEPANLHCCPAVNRHSAVAVFFFFFSPPSAEPQTPPAETFGTSDDSQAAELWKLLPS